MTSKIKIRYINIKWIAREKSKASLLLRVPNISIYYSKIANGESSNS
jgi:hypothetical protein